MARELGDVLHYFIPEPAARPERKIGPGPQTDRVAVVAVPLGEHDLVRAAFVWNLAVEAARLGTGAAVLAARGEASEALWPAPGAGPLGAELVLCGARDLSELAGTAQDLARERAAGGAKDGLVLVCVPPDWLRSTRGADALLRWVLIFATPDPRDLRASYGLLEQLARVAPGMRVGVTMHGVQSIDAAREGFARLAGAAERDLGRGLLSYGLLLDDLHVYRAIVSLRPLGLAHPQSRGARALRDVARLLLEDAQGESP